MTRRECRAAFLAALLGFAAPAVAQQDIPIPNPVTSGGPPAPAPDDEPVKRSMPSQSIKSSERPGRGVPYYGKLEMRHHYNDYYSREGRRLRKDPSIQTRLQAGSKFYDQFLDMYVTLGVTKRPESQQLLQRRPEVAADVYLWNKPHFVLLAYGVMQFPINQENSDRAEDREFQQETQDPLRGNESTVSTIGLSPTVKGSVTLGPVRFAPHIGVDAWTRFYSRKQYLDPEAEDPASGEERRGYTLVEGAPPGEDFSATEDKAMRYALQGIAGTSIQPLPYRWINFDAGIYHDSRFVPVYTYSGENDVSYHYNALRSSFYRLKVGVDITPTLEMSYDFFHYYDNFFKDQKSGAEKRYRHVTKIAVKL